MIFLERPSKNGVSFNGSGLTDILDLMQGQSDGTMLAITVEMPKSVFNPLPGHAFVAEKMAGETVFLDQQSGKYYTNPRELFDSVKEGSTKYMKINDLDLSDRGVSACKEV